MIRCVVDASVAVEYLLRTRLGLTLAEMLESAVLLAPELLDAEALSVLRRAVLQGRLSDARALQAVDDLVLWPIERIPHRALTHLAWQYRQRISAPTTPSTLPLPGPTTSRSSPPTPA